MPSNKRRIRGFTLIELLVVVAIIALLISIAVPMMSRARESARGAVCLSNQRQIALGSRMYLDDRRGEFFHHHEGWVLDDGTQLENLPDSIDGVRGGGSGNSQAEKPWIIFIQPYLKSRKVGFCPSDPTPKSKKLATTLLEYNGGIADVDEPLPKDSELALAEENRLTTASYLLNSVLTHKSARYAVEGVLNGFMTDSRAAGLKFPDMILYSERNSEAMNAADNEAFGSIGQDDYDTWVGEAALVRWGEEAGAYANDGWVRYSRHRDAANYALLDGSAARMRWSRARERQFPDRVVRQELENPPR